jgi:membrane-bound lytic murein transglycosylase F
MGRIASIIRHSLAAAWFRCWIVVLVCILAGCNDTRSPEPTEQTVGAVDASALPPSPIAAQLHQGDLAEIRSLGQLRILVHHGAGRHLPRSDYASNPHLVWLERFAKQQGLELRLVAVDNFADLVPALLEGQGDVIASNMTVLPERKRNVNFTLPLDTSREYVVTRANDPLSARSDLAGRTVAVQPDTSFAITAAQLQARHPELELESADASLGNEALLDKIAAGSIDLSIADGNYLRSASQYRDDVRAAFPVTINRDIAWAVRPGAINLLGELNRFISREKPFRPMVVKSDADLGTILERGTLRVAMRNNMASYFLWRGQLYGFEYELAKRFADHHNLTLQIVTFDDYSQVFDLLREGRVDVVAAFLTPTPWRAAINVAYSRPYHYSSEILVTRPGSTVTELDQLNTRIIEVRKSSSYWQTLQNLILKGTILRLRAAPENLDTEQLIDEVGKGNIDLTVADSHILDLELRWRNDVTASLSLTGPRPHSWATRDNNPELLHAIDQFFLQEYGGDFHQRAIERYFATPRNRALASSLSGQELQPGSLSRYDELIRRYASLYQFDWRLITAQVSCESGFDPLHESFDGAQGLLQILPQTALALGFENILEPDGGLHAGLKYMAQLRAQLPDSIDPDQRDWFTLAAYNAGIGHVEDAMALAQRRGDDPNQWFDHVEQAMLLLSQPSYARRARFGMVKGIEPVTYVKNVRDKYYDYLAASGQTPIATPARAASQ